MISQVHHSRQSKSAEVEVLIWRSEVQRRCRGAGQGAEVQRCRYGIWDMPDVQV